MKEALRSFNVLETPVYANKHIGLSGQLEAMPCECSQQEFLSHSRGSSRESRHSRRGRASRNDADSEDATNNNNSEDEDDDNELCGPDSNCINRLTFIECFGDHCGCPSMAETEKENSRFRRPSQKCATKCANRRFQNREYAKIDIFSAGKKGYGVRALEPISAGQFIYEYTGEVLDEARFVRRQQKYEREGVEHFYFMMLQKEEYIDATEKGSIARFCNHSCNPNAGIEKWVVGPKLRMGLFAKKDIQQGEEICFDYKVDRYGSKAQPCYCNEPNCSGFLGGRTQTGGAALPPSVIEGLGLDSETVSDWPERALERLLKCNLDLVRVLNEQKALEKALKEQSQSKAVSPPSKEETVYLSNQRIKEELLPPNPSLEGDLREQKVLSSPEKSTDQPPKMELKEELKEELKGEIKEEDQLKENRREEDHLKSNPPLEGPNAEDHASPTQPESSLNNPVGVEESQSKEKIPTKEETPLLSKEELFKERTPVMEEQARREKSPVNGVMPQMGGSVRIEQTPVIQHQPSVLQRNGPQDVQPERLSKLPEKLQSKSPSPEKNSNSPKRVSQPDLQSGEVDLRNKHRPPTPPQSLRQGELIENANVKPQSQEEVSREQSLPSPPSLKVEIPVEEDNAADPEERPIYIPSPVRPLSESELQLMQQARPTQVQSERDYSEPEFHYHLSHPVSLEVPSGNLPGSQEPADLHHLPPVVQPLASNNELFHPSDTTSRNSTKQKQSITNQFITVLDSKPLTKEMEIAREELIASFPLTEMSLDDLPEFMRILMQLQESPWIIRLMLMRVLANEDQTLQSGILNMHGYQIMGTVLNRWTSSPEILNSGLQVLQKWPKVTKNKISSSQIESVVTDIKNENINPEVTKLASDLLEEWSGLSMGYRIPRRKLPGGSAKKERGDDDSAVFDKLNADNDENYRNHDSNDVSNHENTFTNMDIPEEHHPSRIHRFADSRKPRITPEMEEEAKLRKREEEEERLRQQAIARERERQQAEIQRIIDEASGIGGTAASLTPSATPDTSAIHNDSHDDGKHSVPNDRKKYSVIESALASYVPKLVFIYQDDLGRDRCKRHSRDIVQVLVKKEKSKDTKEPTFDLTKDRKNKIKSFVKEYMQKVLSRHSRSDSTVLPSPKRVHGNS